MGNRYARSTTPAAPRSTTIVARHVLPADLPSAIKQLTDHELERLVTAALAEQKRRGRKPQAFSNKRPIETVPITLTPSKMNAVRAAFKAGIKPSQIARQFSLSRSDVQKILASGRE
jgi:predicted DNA-binding protein (UPF0251 family)